MAIWDELWERVDRSGRGWLGRVERFLDDVVLLPDDVRRRLDEAEADLAAERFAGAERGFVDVLGARPSLGRAALGLAKARHGLGDGPGTLAALAEARALAPKDAELALWHAHVALEARALEDARAAAAVAARGLAAQGGSRFADACATLAWAEWHLGRPDRAARELRKALSIEARPALQVALVVALVDAGAGSAARATAGKLRPDALSGTDGWRVGDALVRADAPTDARPFLEAAAAAGEGQAVVALGRLRLAEGAADEAIASARQAIATGGGAPALVLLAEALLHQGQEKEAAEAYEAAAQVEGDATYWRAALRAAPLTEQATLERLSAALAAHAPQDPLVEMVRVLSGAEVEATQGSVEPAVIPDATTVEEARLALAWAMRAESEQALALLARFDLLATAAETSGDVAFGQIRKPLLGQDSSQGRDGTIQRSVLRVSRSDRALAATRLRALWLARWRRPSLASAPEEEKDATRPSWMVVDLPRALDTFGQMMTSRAPAVVLRAQALREELDRPLLLGVLGEFNAGKSTFVNAFIGSDVAPMGIVPTTATLNLLRSGAERLVRVVFRDGRTREGTFEVMRPMLQELDAVGADASGAAVIDRVEILLPGELLERVWILDSPGTNALDAEHERLAQEAARRADAVLWIFDASQAGKLSETKMHETLSAQGREVVPILNKADRLKDGELARVSGVIEEGFGRKPVPLSAKRALKARLAGDDEALAASGYQDLLTALEQRVFARTRELKARACAGRLRDLVAEALADEAAREAALEARLAALKTRREAIDGVRRDALLATEDATRGFGGALDQVFEAAREEVRLVGEGRGALHNADRLFLSEHLRRELASIAEVAERELVAGLAALFSSVWVAEGAEDTVEPDTTGGAEKLAHRFVSGGRVATVWAAFVAYQRGRIDGGIERVLGMERATPESVDEGLRALRADAKRELAGPLAEAVEELVHQVEDRLRGQMVAARMSAQRDRFVAQRPLDVLHDLLTEMLGA